MKALKIDLTRMLKDAQVRNNEELSSKLRCLGVNVSARTFYRWQNGTGFSSPKFIKVTEALRYDDPVSLISWIKKTEDDKDGSNGND